MKLIIIIIINIEKKKILQNLKWATAHLSRRLGAGALGRAGVGAGALGWALGERACGRRLGARWEWHGTGAAGNGRAGVRSRRGACAGRAAGGAQALGAGAGRAQGTRQARGLGAGRAAWALGARPGRLGWPWAVHLVHSAHFRSVLTRFFFPESPNEHRSL